MRSPADGRTRTSVRRNVVANFFATGWTAILGLAVLPLNIHFLGIEAYALLGIYGTILALASLLDVGLGPTVNRELARLSPYPDRAGEMRTLVRSLEIVYWILAVIAGALVVLLAPLVARQWLDPAELSYGQVEIALMLMGLVLAIQLPASLYTGGLQGLQVQVRLSTITAVAGTLRAVGGVLILWLVAPTIAAFFLWQAAISVLTTGTLGVTLWMRLPSGDGAAARFDGAALRRVWRFAAGVTGHAILRVLLTQSDKVILSRLLPLQVFGYYTLAATLAGALGRLVEPIYAAFFPRFSELVARGERVALVEVYQRACQLVSVILLPAAVVLGVFAHRVLTLWTGNASLADETHVLVTLLVAGTALNGLMYLPYALQLAHGWTRLAFWFNLAAVIVLVPSLVFATQRWGAAGAAFVWMGLNACYLLIQIPLMHRRVLRGEAARWYFESVAAPLAAALAIAAAGWLLMRSRGDAEPLAAIVAVGACSLAAAMLSIPWLRAALAGWARRRRASAR